MSTRRDTPPERNDVDPYAPRWVRDPSYQVLRRAETLKHGALGAPRTEPAPSIPCEEPDLPPDLLESLKKLQQSDQDEMYIGNIRVPPSMRPKEANETEREAEEWPRRRPKKRSIGRRALPFALAIAAAGGAAYFLTWTQANQAVDAAGETRLASLDPSAAAPIAPPLRNPVKTVRITPDQKDPWPSTAASPRQPQPNSPDPWAATQRPASQSGGSLPASNAAPAKTAARLPGMSKAEDAVSAAPANAPSASATKLDKDAMALFVKRREQLSTSGVAPAKASPWPTEPMPKAEDAASAAPPANTPSAAATKLDAGTIALFVERGERFIEAGDFASARVLLRRAAEAGDRKAALAMAATYDPAALKRFGVKGLAPDPELARYWYERARSLGSTEAPKLLKQLANRTE
jgi:TPR repeat protein